MLDVVSGTREGQDSELAEESGHVHRQHETRGLRQALSWPGQVTGGEASEGGTQAAWWAGGREHGGFVFTAFLGREDG